jgi:hypothetical protein
MTENNLNICMELSDQQADTAPIFAINTASTERQVAVAIERSSVGLGVGNALWLIIRANKDTGELMCALRTTLPVVFLPR